MNAPQNSKSNRRRYLWLFAALLPCVLFGVIKWVESQQPLTLFIGAHDVFDDIAFYWMPNSKQIWVLQDDPKTHVHWGEVWDVKTRRVIQTYIPPKLWNQQTLLPSLNSPLVLGHSYSNWPNHLWNTKTNSYTNIGSFYPLAFHGKYLIGQDWVNHELALVWCNIKTKRIDHVTHFPIPKGYDDYFAGHCGDFGPFLAISSDGKIGFLGIFKTASDDPEFQKINQILVFDAWTGKRKSLLKFSTEGVGLIEGDCFQSAQNGRLLLVFDHSDNPTSYLRLWDVKSGRKIRAWPCTDWRAVISSDGNWLAYSIEAKAMTKVRLRSTKAGALPHDFSIPKPVKQLTFSPDSHKLAAMFEDRIIVWPVK